MMLTTMLLSLLSIILSTAFITLLERKMISYSQLRKGPNKVGPYGILQPFSDAMKLLHKQMSSPSNSNSFTFAIMPLLTFSLTMLLLVSIPMDPMTLTDQKHNTITFLMISSILIYPLLSTGWSSNSKYSLLGMFRNTAQMLSYEISMFLMIIFPVMTFKSYNLSTYNMNFMIKPMMLCIPLFLMWLNIILSETNRSPFDFAEGESELVSGFNVEFMSLTFTLIFLAEYSMISIMSMFTILLFMPMNLINMMMIILLSMFIIMSRSTLPRYRFDLLMTTNWKIFLPSSIIPTLILLLMSH